MRERRPAELVMGSVQLGIAYGAANRTGKPPHATALRLVERAADSGIGCFDTARAYGDAEERLGEALGRRRVRTVTKLAPLDTLAPDAPREIVRAAVDESIMHSLAALRVPKLDCLLVHRAHHMSAYGGAIWKRLQEHLEDGLICALGVSVQSPAEAMDALAQEDVAHIQLPFNLLDWRWRDSGATDAFCVRRRVTVHARSVFLQGVLAADDPIVWPRIEGLDAQGVVNWLSGTASEFGRESAADLCLAYVRGQPWVDGVVIGMETETQLDLNLRLSTRRPLTAEECAAIDARAPRVPARLLDPAQWPRA